MRACTAASLWVLAALCSTACSRSGTEYFPLGQDQSWEYSVQRVIKGEKQTQKIIIAALPPASVDGTTFFVRRRLDDRLEFYRSTDRGIFRVQPGISGEREVLPHPARRGAAWRETTRVRFLQVTGAFAGTFNERAHTDMPIRYVIASVDDTVDVPAGRFYKCLRVSGKGSMLAGDTLEQFMNIHDIKVDETAWYAPGVGLVKRVRTESTSPADWSTRYLEQLEAMR